jgi:hypothetical protein
VITVLLDAPPQRFHLDSEEQIAFVRLAEAGLVPPLRLVEPGRSGANAEHGAAEGGRSGDTRGIA